MGSIEGRGVVSSYIVNKKNVSTDTPSIETLELEDSTNHKNSNHENYRCKFITGKYGILISETSIGSLRDSSSLNLKR
jgi:hypothetical protein